MFEFLNKILSLTDLQSVVESRNLNFNTDNKGVLQDLKEAFGEDSPYFFMIQEIVVCRIPLQVAGLSLLSVREQEFKTKLDKREQAHILEGFLSKSPEKTEVEDGRPIVKVDFIDPKYVLQYLDFLIPELESRNDEDAYVWILKSEGRLEDYYQGVYCRFSTIHSNKFDQRYKANKRDFCLVMERYDDTPLHWLPLQEGEVIKGDNVEFQVEKLNLETLLKEQAYRLRKMAEIAQRHELELSKDNR